MSHSSTISWVMRADRGWFFTQKFINGGTELTPYSVAFVYLWQVLGFYTTINADIWGKTLNETSTPFNNMMELYFEDFDIDGLLAKYESGKYFVRYATELTELAGGQKLVRLYDPSGNLIEVRTPFRCN